MATVESARALGKSMGDFVGSVMTTAFMADAYRIALEEIRDRDNLDAAAMRSIAKHALAK